MICFTIRKERLLFGGESQLDLGCPEEKTKIGDGKLQGN